MTNNTAVSELVERIEAFPVDRDYPMDALADTELGEDIIKTLQSQAEHIARLEEEVEKATRRLAFFDGLSGYAQDEVHDRLMDMIYEFSDDLVAIEGYERASDLALVMLNQEPPQALNQTQGSE